MILSHEPLLTLEPDPPTVGEHTPDFIPPSLSRLLWLRIKEYSMNCINSCIFRR